MIKKIFSSELFWTLMLYALLISCIIGIIYMLKIADEKRCIEKGGVYIWEWSSFGQKCHLVEKKQENRVIRKLEIYEEQKI